MIKQLLTLSQTRMHAWFAIAILLLGALAPGISVGLSHGGDSSGWQDICSSSSMTAANSAGQPAGAMDMLTYGHCACCHLQTDDIAPLPSVPKLQLLGSLQFMMPARFWTAPRTAHGWAPAQARAPPLHS